MDWLADIVRLLDTLNIVTLGATPIHLPVVAFSWNVLPKPSNVANRVETDKAA